MSAARFAPGACYVARVRTGISQRSPSAWGQWLSALVVLGAAACAVDDRRGRVLDNDAEGGASGAAGTSGAPVGSAGSGSGGPGAAGAGAPGGGGSASGGPGAGGTEGLGGATPLIPSAGASGSGGSSAGGAGGSSALGSIPAGCETNLLGNGNFDAGDTTWTNEYEVRSAIVAADSPELQQKGVTPYSGNYLGWLGGVANGEYGEQYVTRLTQVVNIPENVISLEFSARSWVNQPEPGLPFPYIDWAVIEFLDPLVTEGYDNLWQVGTWNEEDVTTGWVEFRDVQTEQMDRFRGRSLPIQFDSRPDGNGTFSLWLDDVSLVAHCN